MLRDLWGTDGSIFWLQNVEHTCSVKRNGMQDRKVICASLSNILIHTAAFKHDPTVWMNNLSHLSFSHLQDIRISRFTIIPAFWRISGLNTYIIPILFSWRTPFYFLFQYVVKRLSRIIQAVVELQWYTAGFLCFQHIAKQFFKILQEEQASKEKYC